MTPPPLTREAWLAELARRLEPWFMDHEWPLDPGQPRQFAVGFPKGGRRAIGQCWSPDHTSDGTVHIYVSPVLTDGLEAAGVLAHELLHAAVGVEHKHDRVFARACKRLGLEGKATEAGPGPELQQHLVELLTDLPPYSHAPITLAPKLEKQTTRMRKAVCPQHPDYLVRLTKTHMERGMPGCGICLTRMVAAG